MEKLRAFALLLTGMVFSMAVYAQTTPEMTSSQERRINKTFETRYSGLSSDSVQWRLNDEGHYEGTFRFKNRNMVATFDNKGNWRNTVEAMRLEDLPEEFRNSLNNEHGRDKVARVQRIEDSDNKTYYDVRIRGERDPIRYDSNGTRVRSQNRPGGN